MEKYLRISYYRKTFLIYDFAPGPIFWISLFMRKIMFFFFISVQGYLILAGRAQAPGTFST